LATLPVVAKVTETDFLKGISKMRKTLLSAVTLLALALPAGAQTLDRIKDTKELKLGFRTDAAPLSFAGEGGRPDGYSPMLCAEIAQAIANILRMEELNAVFYPVGTQDRFDKVASGDIDLLCGAATITLRRREIVDFSVPTYVDGVAILLPQDGPEHLEDFAGKTVGVRSGTTTQEALNNSLNAAGVAAEIKVFEDHAEGVAALESGDIAAYFADQSILYNLYANSAAKDTLKVTGEILTIEKHGLALARGDSEFRLVVDAALSQLYASGRMEEIFAEALPGVTPGLAVRAMHLIAPTIP